jgi:glycosyltransferase involved in cell wall biosynthesis
VAYIHEVLGPIWDSFYPWPLSTIGRVQEQWTHWLYRQVPFWTPSDSTKKVLQQHGVRQVHVFPNGTDATPLAELEPKPLAMPLRLTVVCRLAPNKRVEHAIQAVNILKKRGTDAQLTIVGTGEVENSLRQLTKELSLTDRVKFTGRLDELMKNDCLRQAHFLVHTSVREGWGLNVIEANAMGTPAIVYPVGGLVDSTIHDETGWVTSGETPESIADTIQTIIQTPTKYDRLRTNAWKRSQKLTWPEVLPPACDWLESLASKSSK